MATLDLDMMVEHEKLGEIIQRILKVAKPRQIILFGSAARGQMTLDSDLDLLVIVQGPVHRRQIEQQIYANLRGVLIPVDVIVATNEDIAKYGNKVGMIYRSALKDGKVIYES